MNSLTPEPGQLVEIRRRQWIVSDVDSSAITAGTRAENLLHLTSLDEDSTDETLSVIWELEPGARILETAGLPEVDGWDSCEYLESFLDAVRWGATTHADRALLQSPFRSGIDIEDYQLDPLVRSIDMTRTSLLIADDVGLGKTIEAGLVIQELLIRHRARTVLIVCPASLQVKWQAEMAEKFGLDFRIVDTSYLKTLRRERGIGANPWSSFPRLISSMDWMKSGEGLRLLRDSLPARATFPRKFDILVVDEAHNVAPAGSTRYAMPSQRTRLIRTLVPHFEHKLFLSATPHNGYKESFTNLLELLDDQRFARGVLPDEKQLQAVMVRRLKTSLVDKDGKPLYARRELLPLSVEYDAEEQRIHGLLDAYGQSRLSDKLVRTSLGSEFVQKLLKKRLFSSPRAFSTTLAKHRQSLSKATGSKDVMTERILHRAIARCEEDYADDEQLEASENEAVEIASSMAPELTDEQRRLLDSLSNWAEASKNRSDSKSRSIIRWIEEHLKSGNDWNEKRVILFTEYVATHDWMFEILTAGGFGGDRLLSLKGGTPTEDREKIKAAFQANPADSPVRILLATDAASEGIDLQNHCNYLIHLEIPWNPNVMEQRNGRIDRHGQKEAKVYIWHPVGSLGTEESDKTAGDDEFLMTAVRKVDSIREDLGCVGPVIAKQIEEAMLGKRKRLDTQAAENKADGVRRSLATEKKLQERIARLHQRLVEARDAYHLTPERIRRTVEVALALLNKPNLIELSGARFPQGSVFKVPILSGSWNQATAGLAHPHTGVRRPITFDHSTARGRDDVVLAHLEHKLVQMSLRVLRAEVWAHFDRKKLRRVAVRRISDGSIEQPIVLVWSRLLIVGGIHQRLHEELTLAGGELRKAGFARTRSISQLEDWLNRSQPCEPKESTFSVLQTRFKEQKTSILSAVEARSRERLQFLTNTIERRRAQEEKDMNFLLDELALMIQEELKEEEVPVQLELWPTEEREQLRKDMQALRDRLDCIPAEREREIGEIRRRYSDTKDRTFPVAVEFIVPDGFEESL